MNRRQFIKLSGNVAAIAVAAPLFPAIAAAPVPLPIPHTHTVDDLVEHFHQLVVDEMETRLKAGNYEQALAACNNPHWVTRADLGLSSINDIMSMRAPHVA